MVRALLCDSRKLKAPLLPSNIAMMPVVPYVKANNKVECLSRVENRKLFFGIFSSFNIDIIILTLTRRIQINDIPHFAQSFRALIQCCTPNYLFECFKTRVFCLHSERFGTVFVGCQTSIVDVATAFAFIRICPVCIIVQQ